MTDFAEIYNRAIFRISDYALLDEDVTQRHEILRNYLMSAQVDFQNSCNVDLSDYNEEAGSYNMILNDEEIEILSLGVAYYWLSAKTLNSELLHNVLTSKDYVTYSPANLLKEVQTLRNTIKKEFEGKIKQYGYRHASIGTLKN